jgi:hypothetical protein
MVAPNPAPSGQANYNSILPILALAANSKGSNTGDLSKIFNELMGIMSGSYTRPSEMSPEEIEAVYGPTIASIRNSTDPILQSILGDVDANTPAFKVKEAIRQAVYNTKTIQLQPGQDIEMYDSLVDKLYSEKQRVDEKKYEVANKKTIFEEYGLPDIADRFDPTQMPEYANLYNDLLSKRDISAKERDARVKAIEDKFMAGKPKAGAQTASFDDILKGLSYGELASGKEGGPAWRQALGGSEIQALKTKAERIKQYMDGKSVNTPYTDPKTGKVVNNFWGEDDFNKAVSEIENTVGVPLKFKAGTGPAKISSRQRAIDESNKEYLKELAGAPARNLKVGATGGPATEIPTVNLRDPVARQEELMRLVTDKLQNKMQERGQTPLSEALISRLLLNKQMGG